MGAIKASPSPQAAWTVGSLILSLRTIFAEHDGHHSDKWMQYLTIYDREVGALVAQQRPLRLLEICVQNGGSLQVWQKFLPEGSIVRGIDIDPKCGELKFDKGIKVSIADSGDPNALLRALGDETFDIIVDDGSHLQTDILNALSTLFDRLTPGGVYLIEDLHCSYWASHEGGLRKKGAAIERLKDYVDALHVDYFEQNDTQTTDEAERKLLMALGSQIARIAFYDSVVAIEKYPEPKTAPFLRVLSVS